MGAMDRTDFYARHMVKPMPVGFPMTLSVSFDTLGAIPQRLPLKAHRIDPQRTVQARFAKLGHCCSGAKQTLM
jgi:hypothetical protein